ncbi:MAG: ABC transporter permease [Dehalococcoidia bacterium]
MAQTGSISTLGDHAGVAAPAIKGRSPAGEAWRRLRKKRLAMIGMSIIILIMSLGLLAPVLPIQSFSAQDLSAARQTPSLAHPLGTDDLGRDQLSRLIWGAQTAFIVATVPMILSMSLAVSFGLAAAWYGGWFDTILQRFSEYLMAFPGMLLMIFLAATFKPVIVSWVREIGPYIGAPGLWRTGIVDYMAVLLILALLGWPGLARIVRGQALSLRTREYVEAARAMGASDRRIIFVHMLPQILGLMVVIASGAMAGAIAAESTISFLGIGIVPPYPSWGSMIADNYGKLRTPSWWLLFEPLLVVVILLYPLSISATD